MPYDDDLFYPVIAGSPQAYLAESITADQTTIKIDDPSKLPTPPALAVIGTDQYSETIYYENIEIDTLTGVQRRIDGSTSRAWDKGVKISCVLTAQHIRALQKGVGEAKGAASDVSTELITHKDETANQGHTPKIKTITAASYTLLAEDNGAIIRMNSASPQEVTLPAGLDVGHETVFKQVGEGQTTLIAGTGATIASFDGEVKSTGQNATFGVYIDAENVFTPTGNLEAV